MEFKLVGGTPPAQSIATENQDLAVHSTFGAAAFTQKPDEYTTVGRIMGHFSAAGFTAAAAFTGSTLMAAFRWADPSSVAVVKRVRVAMNVVTAVTAQAGPDVDLIVARNYSARDATGATAVPITSDTGKMRQAMGTSVLGSAAGGNFDVTSAAGGLTAGTKTADASVTAVAPVPLTGFTIGGASPIITLFDAYQIGQHPLLLRQYEGILVRNVTAIATGTVRYYVAIDWLEAAGY